MSILAIDIRRAAFVRRAVQNDRDDFSWRNRGEGAEDQRSRDPGSSLVLRRWLDLRLRRLNSRGSSFSVSGFGGSHSGARPGKRFALRRLPRHRALGGADKAADKAADAGGPGQGYISQQAPQPVFRTRRVDGLASNSGSGRRPGAAVPVLPRSPSDRTRREYRRNRRCCFASLAAWPRRASIHARFDRNFTFTMHLCLEPALMECAICIEAGYHCGPRGFA